MLNRMRLSALFASAILAMSAVACTTKTPTEASGPTDNTSTQPEDPTTQPGDTALPATEVIGGAGAAFGAGSTIPLDPSDPTIAVTMLVPSAAVIRPPVAARETVQIIRTSPAQQVDAGSDAAASSAGPSRGASAQGAASLPSTTVVNVLAAQSATVIEVPGLGNVSIARIHTLIYTDETLELLSTPASKMSTETIGGKAVLVAESGLGSICWQQTAEIAYCTGSDVQLSPTADDATPNGSPSPQAQLAALSHRVAESIIAFGR